MRRVVPLHPGTTLGQYVPFNFCPRSVMLYVLYQGHDTYRGGQGEILHLTSTVGHGIDCGRAWAFSDRHPDLGYAEFHNDIASETEVDWSVMPLHYWPNDKECRQAEFLVYDWFPWASITGIGVIDRATKLRVETLLHGLPHQPAVNVEPDWYY